MTILAKAKLIAGQRTLLLTLCSLFIFSQVASSQHELEHGSHEYHATCDIYLHHAGSANACGNIITPDFYLVGAVRYASGLSPAPLTNDTYVAPIRAPPSSSQI